MKVILCALNAKYIHSSLSVRCLKNAVSDLCDCIIKEYSINDTIDSICRDIHSVGADCVAFSCYIWNIDMVLKLSAVLKCTNPEIKIILGGYEVMFDSVNILSDNPQIDAVIGGEGEITLANYLKAVTNCGKVADVCGITYRSEGKIISNPEETDICDLNSLPFAYEDGFEQCKDKIVYYESSRGCPFGCTYCISGKDSRVRFVNVDRVKRELDCFIDGCVPLVKFVDRTFNANPKRAKEILRHIASRNGNTVFHMEIAGDILDDETIEIASSVREGMLRFEIGVQTTNSKTMKAIERNISYKKLAENVEKLRSYGNVHLHLDLIAGLPYEDIESFKKSFNDVIRLKPHVLQLGFLKLLKGSKIRAQEKEFGYVYSPFPPYEVISNEFMSYDDILEIKGVEEALERYYNSGSFVNTMNYLFEKHPSEYDVFKYISDSFSDSYPAGYAFSKQKLYEILLNCFSHMGTEFFEKLKMDYLINFRPGKRPEWFDKPDLSLLEKTYAVFRDEKLKKEFFPEYYDVPAKEVMKHMHPERFSYGVLLFDYKERRAYNITRFVDSE